VVAVSGPAFGAVPGRSEAALDVGDHGVGVGGVHQIGAQQVRVDLAELEATLTVTEDRPVVDAPTAGPGQESCGLRLGWNIELDMVAHGVLRTVGFLGPSLDVGTGAGRLKPARAVRGPGLAVAA
jgi:hypothetical protein